MGKLKEIILMSGCVKSKINSGKVVYDKGLDKAVKEILKHYIPISEVEEIKKECSDVSMMIEVSLGYMKPETKAYYHLELAQKMLSKIWFPHKTNKEEVNHEI